jgi:hypothetical protein
MPDAGLRLARQITAASDVERGAAMSALIAARRLASHGERVLAAFSRDIARQRPSEAGAAVLAATSGVL